MCAFTRTEKGIDIQITALHSHMLNDQPHLFFMHTWSTGNAMTQAETVRTALNQSNTKPGTAGPGKG